MDHRKRLCEGAKLHCCVSLTGIAVAIRNQIIETLRPTFFLCLLAGIEVSIWSLRDSVDPCAKGEGLDFVRFRLFWLKKDWIVPRFGTLGVPSIAELVHDKRMSQMECLSSDDVFWPFSTCEKGDITNHAMRYHFFYSISSDFKMTDVTKKQIPLVRTLQFYQKDRGISISLS